MHVRIVGLLNLHQRHGTDTPSLLLLPPPPPHAIQDLGPFASTRNLLRPAFSLVAAEMAWRCNTYLRMPTWDDIDAVLVAGGCSCCQCPV